MRTAAAIVALVIAANAAHAQNKELIDALQNLDIKVFKPDSGDAKLRWDSVRQLRDDVNKRDVEAWRKIKTKADWEMFRSERLAKLRISLGATRGTVPDPVKVVVTKTIRGDGFIIQNLIYDSHRPSNPKFHAGFYVTANLYAPADFDKKRPETKPPGIIVIHSHHNPKTQGELQDMGILWARQGCVVLIPDMVGHGERRAHPFPNAASFPDKFAVSRQDYWFRYNTAMQLHLVGESLAGWMVYDLMRGVDLLFYHANVDTDRLIALGSVAGGGDPCAVFAAIDGRIRAAAPFNFGGPQPETKFPLPEDADLAFNYMGGASWESTRNLRWSGRDGFLPWLIVGSIAPRGLIYGHEFSWDQERDPVWRRFNTIWGDFYGVKDKLSFAKGRGSVKGQAPESTHCNNIGFEHRKPIYPTLKKWFDIPLPEENKKRFDSSELQCWTDEARKSLKPKALHERAQDFVRSSVAREGEALRGNLLHALGVGDVTKEWKGDCGLSKLAGKVESVADKKLPGGHQMLSGVLRHEKTPTVAMPFVILKPANAKDKTPIVVALAQDGKAGFFKHRSETITRLLESGIAVCIPDLRGAGETANDGRNRTSGATSYSAALQMHGMTVPGVQLIELVMLMRELPKQGFGSIALWGDSFVEPNAPDTNFAVPHDAKLPRQAEPMGGTLALLGGIFGDVKAVYVRGGMVSFRSMLDSSFCYFPHDAVIPDIFPAGDMDVLAGANRNVRLESLVDGLNRRADDKTLKATYAQALKSRPASNPLELHAEPSTAAEVAAWLVQRAKK